MGEESVIPCTIGVQHETEIDLFKELLDPSLNVSFSAEVGGHRKGREEKERSINGGELRGRLFWTTTLPDSDGSIRI
jgi:hypothetical protein